LIPFEIFLFFLEKFGKTMESFGNILKYFEFFGNILKIFEFF